MISWVKLSYTCIRCFRFLIAIVSFAIGVAGWFSIYNVEQVRKNVDICIKDENETAKKQPKEKEFNEKLA